MRVSVVVPTYRRPELLAHCLAALSRQRMPCGPLAPRAEAAPVDLSGSKDVTEADSPPLAERADHWDYEVIVADDSGGDEATNRVVQKAAATGVRFRYLAVTGNHGPAAARNAGWRAAQGEIIAFTDDDCVPDRGWLAAGIASFADPRVVAATGRTIVPLPPQPTDYERDAAGLERAEFVTANCFVRRAALLDLRGFDESFTAAWREDSDLHFRLLDTGRQIAKVDGAIVIHPVRPAPWGISLKQQKKVRFDALLFRKHPQRFRERIKPSWPWHYYVIVMSAAVALAAAVLGFIAAAAIASALWAAFTARFLVRRLRETAKTTSHLAEMIVTSLVIPFAAVFWRIYGAVRYRVVFW